MKKRILSGLLALATMITIVPLSGTAAFAAEPDVCPECGSEDFYYEDEDHKEYSETQHAVETTYCCSNCDHEWTETEYEDHNWEYYESYIENSSDTQHAVNTVYHCEDCDAEKTETELKDHEWELDEYEDKTYTYVSPTTHEVTKHYICAADVDDFDWGECDATKTVTKTAKHVYENGVCKYCVYPKKSRTMKDGEYTYFNGRPWLKIVVKKNGYIRLAGSPNGYELYDKSKKKYKYDVVEATSPYSCAAVKKGTYYIRMISPNSDGENFKLKYVFHEVADQKNYAKSKAVTAKKGKTTTFVNYGTDKDKTWNRWYKIKVTGNNKIKLLTSLYGNFVVYNSKNQPVDMQFAAYKESGWFVYKSAKKLKKGTYYVRFNSTWNNVNVQKRLGYVSRFKWNCI